MTALRRIMIAVTGLLLILDAGCLAYVKFTGGPKPSEDKSKVVLWIDNATNAKSAVAVLKEQGYEAAVKPDKRKSEVEADFRVAMKSTKKELLEPIAQILRQGGHSGLSYSEDGTKLYYGGFYKQKSQALRVAERVKSTDQIVFEVIPGSKVVSKPSNRVIIAEVPSNMVESLLAEVSAKVKIDDQSETPLTPKVDEAE